MSKGGRQRGRTAEKGKGSGGAVVAAARAGLNEPSHSLAALTVEAGRRCGELRVLVATVLSEPVTPAQEVLMFISIG